MMRRRRGFGAIGQPQVVQGTEAPNAQETKRRGRNWTRVQNMQRIAADISSVLVMRRGETELVADVQKRLDSFAPLLALTEDTVPSSTLETGKLEDAEEALIALRKELDKPIVPSTTEPKRVEDAAAAFTALIDDLVDEEGTTPA